MTRTLHPVACLRSNALEALTGTGCMSRFPIIGVSQDGSRLLFPGTISQPREHPILPGSRPRALELRAELARLEAQGTDMGGMEIDLDGDGRFTFLRSDKAARNGRALRSASSELVYPLRHGARLTIVKRSNRLNVHVVADFLAEAVNHFKRHRDDFKTVIYEGPYCRQSRKGRTLVCELQLHGPPETKLTAALWTQVVIEAFGCAETVEQMLEDLPTWQQAVQREGGQLREIVGMLDKPGGDLSAMDAMLKRDLERASRP